MKLERIIILGTFVAFLAALYLIWTILNPTAPDPATNTVDSYFRKHNPNPYLHRLNQPRHERAVSAVDKLRVKERDGHKCVICGSTIKIEVDHVTALMNGGDNSQDNLAALCDVCHTEKTRLDWKVRGRRKELVKHPLRPDVDQDGVWDDEDNQPARFNPYQDE